MDHVEIMVRLQEKPDAGMTEGEVRSATRLEPNQVARALRDLVRGDIIRFDQQRSTYHFAPRSAEDRDSLAALAQLYHQRPVTLVKLIYSLPSMAIESFADAFRLREDKP